MGTIRDRLNDAIFARVAGPQGAMHRDRIHGTPGPRWFEPGSPITRVHGDASMYVGGLRAVLLQTLQPQAMTAVAEHSGYRGDIWGRLARTSRFLAVTTFGTAERRPAGGRRGPRDPRAGGRHHARRHAVHRHRPPPPRVGAHRGDPQLPAVPPAVRRPAARPGRARRVRRPDGVRGPPARRRRPADHRGRARGGAGAVPPRAHRHRPRPRGRVVPDLAPRPPAPGPAARTACWSRRPSG